MTFQHFVLPVQPLHELTDTQRSAVATDFQAHHNTDKRHTTRVFVSLLRGVTDGSFCNTRLVHRTATGHSIHVDETTKEVLSLTATALAIHEAGTK